MRTKELREFNRAFKLPMADAPTTKANFELRKKLIQEELIEYVVACKNDDLIEVADAIADMAYLVIGAAVEHGIELDPIFDAVHKSNMSKLDENGKPIIREDGKVMKSDKYFPPKIEKALRLSNVKKYDLEYDINKFIEQLINATCEFYGIEYDDLMSKTRKHPLSEARQVIFYHIKEKYGLYRSYKKPLQKYTKLDRTTIIYGAKKIKEAMEFDKDLQLRVENVYKLTEQKIFEEGL